MVSDKVGAVYFSDDLVEAMVEMIVERWKPNPFLQWICCVPSKNNSQLVPNFARRVATRLNLPFLDVISKIKDNKPQKLQQNRFHQCHNLDGVFKVAQDIPKTPALLIDDIIDSGWTFAVIGALMAKSGCEAVYPVALASATAN